MAINQKIIYMTLLVLLVVLAVFSISIGSAQYTFGEVIHAIFDSEMTPVRIIVMNLRLPRVILAILVGASLAVAGALLQAVMRNPLADPGIIGVSAGAGTVATTIILLFPTMTSAIPLFSFVGAGLACILIYSMAWRQGIDPLRIILSGVAVNSVLGGYNALLQMMHSDSLEGVLAFMNGSLSGKSWNQVEMIFPYTIIGLIFAFLCIKSANLLQLGDEMAKNLGVNINLSRIGLSAVGAFLAASTVSAAGMIGFVGLVVPHISRMFMGSDYKHLIPTSMLLGAITLLIADTIGRTIIPGMEIAVGIVMAVSGGPFFLYLLRKKGKVSGN